MSRTCWSTIVLVASAAAGRSQVAWQQVNVTPGPAARGMHASAVDPGFRVLVFGGYTAASVLDDTWLFDGVTWTQAQPSTHPPARVGHRLAHDLLRGRTVLFGGYNGLLSVLMNDTWEWDGSNWLQRFPTHSPSGRFHYGMAFDVVNAVSVLYGGYVFSGTGLVGDTWAWDGVDWQQVTTAVAPSPRYGVGLAADQLRGRLVLFGGHDSVARNDTWEFGNGSWTQRVSTTTPSARVFPGFCYDVRRGRTVMFGGGSNINTGEFADTWEWNGTDWQQRWPIGAPPAARRGWAMTYDVVHAATVMFGGSVNGNGSGGISQLSDTQTYAATTPASFAAYGAGCGGTAGIPVLVPVDGRAPWIGDAWGLQLAPLPANAPALLVIGFSRTVWGTTPLPMSLAGFGMPGCSLHSSAEVTVFTLATGQIATWPIAIPNNQALVGLTLYSQAAGLDPGANLGGLVVSNGLEITFGGR